VVLQARANAAQCMDRADAGVVQHVGISDARQLQQARRADDAGGHDHFPRGAHHGPLPVLLQALDPGGHLAVEHHTLDLHASQHMEVAAPAGRPKVAARRTRAAPAIAGLLVVPDRRTSGIAVRIVQELHAHLLTRFDDMPTHLGRRRHAGDLHRAFVPSVRAGALAPCFGTAVVRQAVVEGPAFGAMPAQSSISCLNGRT
jgi:hypothetical protein